MTVLRPALQQITPRLAEWQRRGWRQDPVPEATVYGVYRQRNAANVGNLIESFGPSVSVRLHALDGAVPELARHTVGEGPGPRMDLLNGMISAHPPGAGITVLIDDDVAFTHGTGADFLRAMVRCDFDAAQPAHDLGSVSTYGHLDVKPLSIARRVTFVEVGPLVAVSPRARPHFLPPDPDLGMGWGVDVHWACLAEQQGLRLGVVDATTMRHLAPVGLGYHMAQEERRLSEALSAHQLTSPFEITRSLEPRWRLWQRRAPWTH